MFYTISNSIICMNVCILFSLESDVPKENLGIIVQYRVKIRLIVAYGG